MSVPSASTEPTGVRVGRIQVGGGAPVVVQSMTMTDTADPASTATQCIELAEAGSKWSG
jgi:(E)-4-hydroxy-3-methylbut-2-enyl-diphosphate synthase